MTDQPPSQPGEPNEPSEPPPAPSWDDPPQPTAQRPATDATAPAATPGAGSPLQRKVGGIPVWIIGAGAVAAIALVVVLVLALSGGDGDDPDPVAGGTSPSTQTTPGTTTSDVTQTERLDELPGPEEFAAAVARPMELLGGSATAASGALSATDGPGDLSRVNQVARRQAAVVSRARAQVQALPTPARVEQAEAVQKLLSATGLHRRYLDQLARATAGTPSQAHLRVIAQARETAALSLAAYREFYAGAPGVPDTITSVGLAETAPVRAAIETSIAEQEAERERLRREREERERRRTEGRGDVIPDSSGFQSPTGNIRCQFNGSELYCSTANDNFTVVLPGAGGPTTGSGTVGGGPTLGYGAVWSAGGISCQSLTNGLTCENSTGNGFFLSRDSFNQW